MLQQFFDRFKRHKTDSSNTDAKTDEPSCFSVAITVNVYDMFWINEYTNNIGIGVYHSGVEVHGREYCFGGHPFEMSGIFAMQPKDCEMLGENYQFKASLEVGRTEFTPQEISLIIQTLGEEFRGDQYHLLNKNCNHFSENLVQILCGQSLPKWVNRLASISSHIPFIERAIPKEWISPMALTDESPGMYAISTKRGHPPPPRVFTNGIPSYCSENFTYRKPSTTPSQLYESNSLHHWIQCSAIDPSSSTPSANSSSSKEKNKISNKK